MATREFVLTKGFRRINQTMIENFGFRDKSDELQRELEMYDKVVDVIKSAFQISTKKLFSIFQSSGSNHEKRRNKLPLVSYANHLQEYSIKLNSESKIMSENSSKPSNCILLIPIFEMCSNVEHSIASHQADFEMALETNVIRPCTDIVEKDIPQLEKLRKKLHNSRLDMDIARNKMITLEKILSNSFSTTNQSKLDTAIDEYSEQSSRFDHIQDEYSFALLSFFGKQTDHSRIFLALIEYQLEYHRKAIESLESVLPSMKKNIDDCHLCPVFGFSLEDHLRKSDRKIALVFEECALFLRQFEFLNVEGLLRKTGGATQTRHLKAAFDSGIATAHYLCVNSADPHTVANLIKMYLRELPEPLLTFKLYNDWYSAASKESLNERQSLFFNLLDKLPSANFANFRYLIEFLNDVTKYSDSNKMTSSNIAIVIGPNILWPFGSESGSTTESSTASSRIVESFIENYDYYFNTSNWRVISKPEYDSTSNAQNSLSINTCTQTSHKVHLSQINNINHNVKDEISNDALKSQIQLQSNLLYSTPVNSLEGRINDLNRPKIPSKPSRDPPITPSTSTEEKIMYNSSNSININSILPIPAKRYPQYSPKPLRNAQYHQPKN